MSMLETEIDLETSYEFIKEIFNNIKPDQFQQIIKQLEEKQVLFATLLTEESLAHITTDDLQHILQRMFSTKRLRKRWDTDQLEKFKSYTYELLYGTDELADRFEKFCSLSKT